MPVFSFGASELSICDDGEGTPVARRNDDLVLTVWLCARGGPSNYALGVSAFPLILNDSRGLSDGFGKNFIIVHLIKHSITGFDVPCSAKMD